MLYAISYTPNAIRQKVETDEQRPFAGEEDPRGRDVSPECLRVNL